MDPVKGHTVGDDVISEVTEKIKQSGMPQLGFPVCPHCGNDPATMCTMPVTFGLIECLVIYCANEKCRKVFTVEVCGIKESPIVGGIKESPIVGARRRIIGS